MLAESKTNEGIAATHKLWQQSKLDEGKKLFFYQSILTHKIKDFEEKLDISLEGLPVIISGMASSSLGMLELPYHELPFLLDGSDLFFKKTAANGEFNHDAWLISGVRLPDDAMRGEETQLIGCDDASGEDRIFIFPGTHSKHILASNGKAVSFKTFMTGEFLQLLSEKSILSSSVEEHDNLISEGFETGVRKVIQSELLHECFTVRTNQLFGKFSRQENYDYLKGLLIGAELKELCYEKKPVTLVATGVLRRDYEAALKIMNSNKIDIRDSEEALIKGHCKILDFIRPG